MHALAIDNRQDVTANREYTRPNAQQPPAIDRTVLKELSRLAPWRSGIYIVLQWALIIGAVAVGGLVSQPAVYFFLIAFIGARQHDLATILHEAAHYRLASRQRLNDWLGEIISWPFLVLNVRSYRQDHFLHHRHLNSDRDPDWVIKQTEEWRFPMRKGQLLRLLIGDLVGIGFVKNMQRAARYRKSDPNVSHRDRRTMLAARLAFLVSSLALIWWFHLGTTVLLYWVVPFVTWLPLCLRIRSIAEHFALDRQHPGRQVRSVHLTWLDRIFVLSNHTSLHGEHHWFPSVPFYRLHALHSLLVETPHYRNTVEVTRGYWSVLKAACTVASESKPAPEQPDQTPASGESAPPPQPAGRIAARLQNRESGAILRIMAACKQRGGIDLATGIPAMPGHADALAGAVTAVRDGHNAYADTYGVPALRQAIAGKLRRENQLDCDPETEILVTSGITGAFACSLLALFDPGDEIIVPEPYFGWHVNLLRLAGLKPRFLRLPTSPHALTKESLHAALSERTRGIILCTPANPNGHVYSNSELQRVAEVAQERDLLVITDEQYEHFCYDGHRHISPASLAGMYDRTVTLMGFSKSLAVTGWRIGYAAGPAHLLRAIQRVHELVFICAPTPLQHGVAAALRSGAGNDSQLRNQLQGQRDMLCAALVAAGFAVKVPQGGFFVLAEAPQFGDLTADDLAMELLERIGVAAVPGSEFTSQPAAPPMLRFCFAKSDRDLAEGCRRLRTLGHRL